MPASRAADASPAPTLPPRALPAAATAIADSTLLSDERGCGACWSRAIVRHSLLQWGAVAEDGAYVERSLLAEASTVTRKGNRDGLGRSVPTPGSAEGEVSASVVGPFVGFNHHALLVSACWPEGRGNVGYGANVGSNHTGRAPDQEIHPGEGTFFGLGVNVKMPANFSEAPYTIIATGVDTGPQRLRFPFSLMVPGSSPARFPTICFRAGGYPETCTACFEACGSSRHVTVPQDCTSTRTCSGRRSWQRCTRPGGALDEADLKTTYTDRDISGIGGNLLTETGPAERPCHLPRHAALVCPQDFRQTMGPGGHPARSQTSSLLLAFPERQRSGHHSGPLPRGRKRTPGPGNHLQGAGRFPRSTNTGTTTPPSTHLPQTTRW